MSWRSILSVSLMTLLLAACGQSGPLYLPRVPEPPRPITNPARGADDALTAQQSAAESRKAGSRDNNPDTTPTDTVPSTTKP